jgi:WXXGXW repeat (2 copies)
VRARPFMTRIRTLAATVGLLATGTMASGCYVRGNGLATVLGTAFITAAIVSSIRPPPPRVIYVPEPRSGYEWQPGFWTRENGDWVWVEGRWIQLPPHYTWSPTHWEEAPDGTWHLIPGHWAPT